MIPVNIKRSLSALRGHWVELLTLMVLPVLMAATAVSLGNITGYVSLILLPITIPFFYNAYNRIWSLTANIPSKSYQFSTAPYRLGKGSRGAFGIMLPTVVCALVVDILMLLVFYAFGEPLMRAFGHSESINTMGSLFGEWSGNPSDATWNALQNYLMSDDFVLATSGATIVVTGIAFTIGFTLFILWAEGRRFAYVALQRILPDADKNILGIQARMMGKTFTRGLWSTRISQRLKVALPGYLLVLLTYAGAVAGFSFWETTSAPLVSALPIIIAAFPLIPVMIVNAAMDVPLADAAMERMHANATPEQRSSLASIFSDPSYVHSPTRVGQKLFQGYGQPHAGDYHVEYDATSFGESSSGDQKSDKEAEDDQSRGYGFLDLGDGNKDEKEDKKDK